MLNSAAVFRSDLQTNERRKPGGLAAPVCFLESQPPVDESSTKDGHRPAGGPGHAADSERLPQQLRRRSNELMPRTASRCRRYRLVEWLEALHKSVPDAVELIEVSTVDGIF